MPPVCRITQPVVALAALALSEQDLHALCHVDPQKHVWVADDTRDDGERDGLGNRVCGKVFFAEDLHLEVPLHDKGTVETTKHADDDVKDDLEKVPRVIVRDVEHD